MVKNPANPYDDKDEEARDILEELKDGGIDALALALSEARDDSSQGRYRFTCDRTLPLLRLPLIREKEEEKDD